jgi:hypothetical protein
VDISDPACVLRSHRSAVSHDFDTDFITKHPDCMTPPRILFCNCTYANVVPSEVKAAVLKKLCDSGLAFDAVADLCELSARKDPTLKALSQGGSVKIAACFPRAVKWLFSSAGAPLDLAAAEVLNMRTQTADEVTSALFDAQLQPNLPQGKVTAGDAPQADTSNPEPVTSA